MWFRKEIQVSVFYGNFETIDRNLIHKIWKKRKTRTPWETTFKGGKSLAK